MLVTLSLRIIEDAEVRTRCSLLDRFVIPGKGSDSLLHTSDKSASRRALSPRDGAKTGVRLVVRSDCERLIVVTGVELTASFVTLVFFSMT